MIIIIKNLIRERIISTDMRNATHVPVKNYNDLYSSLQICLREQDGKLMTQLMGMNDTIQTLSKQRPTSVRLTRKTLSKGNGRRRFINTNPSIPEETFTELPASVPAISHKSERLSGSLSSLEGKYQVIWNQ